MTMQATIQVCQRDGTMFVLGKGPTSERLATRLSTMESGPAKSKALTWLSPPVDSPHTGKVIRCPVHCGFGGRQGLVTWLFGTWKVPTPALSTETQINRVPEKRRATQTERWTEKERGR